MLLGSFGDKGNCAAYDVMDWAQEDSSVVESCWQFKAGSGDILDMNKSGR